MKSVYVDLSPRNGWKRISRETESVLRAQFYANLLVKQIFNFQGEVCWLKRETYMIVINSTVPVRRLIILGVIMVSGTKQNVEISGNFTHYTTGFPRWSPTTNSDINIYYAPSIRPKDGNTSYEHPSKLLTAAFKKN